MPHRIKLAQEVERRVIQRRRIGTQSIKSEYAEALGDQPWPMKVRLHYYKVVFKQVFWLGDTTTIRVAMGVSSFFFAILLMAAPTQNFARQGYIAMAGIAPAGVWASLFVLHGAGVTWRFMTIDESIFWGLVVNAFGLALWIVYLVLNCFSNGGANPSAAMEFTMVLLAAMALARVGLNDEIVRP